MDRLKGKSIVKSDKVYTRQLKLRELLKPFVPEPRLHGVVFEIEQLFSEIENK
jgi:hypothetical protein